MSTRENLRLIARASLRFNIALWKIVLVGKGLSYSFHVMCVHLARVLFLVVSNDMLSFYFKFNLYPLPRHYCQRQCARLIVTKES